MFILIVAALLAVSSAQPPSDKKFGKYIGSLSTLAYDVSGDVYAVDGKTLFIKDFTYTGGGPAGFFWIGPMVTSVSNGPNDDGLIVPNENGSTKPLGRYSKKDITLTIPGNKTISDLGFFSIWCTDFSVDFGHVLIPRGFRHPEPLTVSGFPTFEHEVTSGPITIVDAQTFLIPDFSYDGQAPAAYFWVGKGQTPGPTGSPIPDENGSDKPFTHPYNKKTIVLSLPGDMTVYDIDYLSVWCEDFRVNFGHINIPKDINVPPSLRMLGVRPESKLNCEVLEDHLAFEVRWAVAGNSLVIQLVGKIEEDQYMAFGLSGSNNRPRMVGGDVVVAGLDRLTGKGFATDYFLTAKSYCALGEGACPDNEIEPRKSNVRLLNAAVVNEFTMITFQRPLKTKDADYDIVIDKDTPIEVIWAIGSIDDKGLAKFHTVAYNKDSKKITFGRKPVWNCPMSESENEGPSLPSSTESSNNKVTPQITLTRPSQETSFVSQPSIPDHTVPPRKRTTSVAQTTTQAPTTTPSIPISDEREISSDKKWFIPPIPCNEPEDGVFYAQMGSAGGKQGYSGITGRISWGIAWYINGLLIPEITVVRGKTYTFVVEGGDHQNNPAKRHPFYITDDPEGGYATKTLQEKKGITIFAGAEQDESGEYYPTGEGRFCKWKEGLDHSADDFESFGAFQRFLSLDCEEGEAGLVQWTPDQYTPDTVYYHCFTHRYLGWKIHVVDSCPADQQLSGSITHVKNSSKNGNLVTSFDPNENDPNDPYVDQYTGPALTGHNPRPSIVVRPNDVSSNRPQIVDIFPGDVKGADKITEHKAPVFIVESQVQAEPLSANERQTTTRSVENSLQDKNYQAGVVVGELALQQIQGSSNKDSSSLFDPNTLVIESGFIPIKNENIELPENYQIPIRKTPVVGAIGHEAGVDDSFNPIFRPSAPDKEVPGPHADNIEVTEVKLPITPAHENNGLPPHPQTIPNIFETQSGPNNDRFIHVPDHQHQVNIQHHVVSGFNTQDNNFNQQISINTQDQLPLSLVGQNPPQDSPYRVKPQQKPFISSVLTPPVAKPIKGPQGLVRFPIDEAEIVEYVQPTADSTSHTIDTKGIIPLAPFFPKSNPPKKKRISLIRNSERQADIPDSKPSSSERREDTVSSPSKYPIPYHKDAPSTNEENKALEKEFFPLDQKLFDKLELLSGPALSPYLTPPSFKSESRKKTEITIPKNNGDVLLSTGYVIGISDSEATNDSPSNVGDSRVYVVPELPESARENSKIDILKDVWSSIQSGQNKFARRTNKDEGFKYFERNEKSIRRKREDVERTRISNGHSNGQFTHNMDADEPVSGNQAIVIPMEKESFEKAANSGSMSLNLSIVLLLTLTISYFISS